MTKKDATKKLLAHLTLMGEDSKYDNMTEEEGREALTSDLLTYLVEELKMMPPARGKYPLAVYKWED